MGIGREGLVEFLEATGRSVEAREVATDADPAASSETIAMAQVRLDFEDRVREMRLAMADTTRLRGVRWEMVHRTSDSALFALAETALDQLHDRDAPPRDLHLGDRQ